jgi:hypothetical protein
MGLWLGMLFKVSFRKLKLKKKKKKDWNRYCIIPWSSAIFTFLPIMNRIAPRANSTLYLIVNRKREISSNISISFSLKLCTMFFICVLG